MKEKKEIREKQAATHESIAEESLSFRRLKPNWGGSKEK